MCVNSLESPQRGLIIIDGEDIFTSFEMSVTCPMHKSTHRQSFVLFLVLKWIIPHHVCGACVFHSHSISTFSSSCVYSDTWSFIPSMKNSVHGHRRSSGVISEGSLGQMLNLEPLLHKQNGCTSTLSTHSLVTTLVHEDMVLYWSKIKTQSILYSYHMERRYSELDIDFQWWCTQC